MKEHKAAFMLIMTSCVYLILAMSLGVLAAMKMMWPAIAEFELFSFPRVRMAHTNIVLFGWLLQVDIGLGRLGRVLTEDVHKRFDHFVRQGLDSAGRDLF